MQRPAWIDERVLVDLDMYLAEVRDLYPENTEYDNIKMYIEEANDQDDYWPEGVTATDENTKALAYAYVAWRVPPE